MSAPAETTDISGILILRHLLTEVIGSCRAAGLFQLSEKLESALRGVQPQPSQPMRRESSALSVKQAAARAGPTAPRRARTRPRG